MAQSLTRQLRGRNLVIGIVAATAAVLLLIIGLSNRGGGSGEGTVLKAVEALAQTDTAHVNAQLHINLPERLRNRQRPLTRIEATVEGDAVRRADGIPEVTGTLRVEARGKGNVFFTEGATRIFADEVAFNLNEFPALLNPSGNLSEHWTYVDASLLKTSNAEAVNEAVRAAAATFERGGRETVNGVRAQRVSGHLTEEHEAALADALRANSSGNQSLHVLARLLDANDVRSLEVWIDPETDEIVKLTADFVRSLRDGRTFDFATLDLAFTDYGKPVALDRPDTQLTVQPHVFSRLFGTGELQRVSAQ